MAQVKNVGSNSSLQSFVEVTNQLSNVLGPGLPSNRPSDNDTDSTSAADSHEVRVQAAPTARNERSDTTFVADTGGGDGGSPANLPVSSSDTGAALGQPLEHSAALAVQSIAQSVAIGVQDASDALRDVATVQNTAIGVATKKMVETKDPTYIPIIQACLQTMEQATTFWTTVGTDGAKILGAYKNLTGD